MEKRHLIKSGIAKIPIVILISLILISLVSAVDFRQIYNPFTRQPDYYRSSNFSGYNLTADYFFGSGEYLININTSGLIKKERDPIWQGNSSWIISNASINYSINTYEMWNTKWSAMNHSTFNKTYEDHTNLINEHIDWTNATDNFKTSGMINVTYLNNKGSIIYTRSDGDLMLTPAGNFIGIYKDIDWIGFGVGESTAKYMFFSWRNALERGEFGTSGYNYPMMFNNILYLDEDDRVGIKTNSPVTELDVNGNVTADYYYGIFTGNVTGNMNWTSLQNYPVACPGTGAITQLGDSVTCSDLWVNVAGDNMTGNLNVSGNVTADYFFGSGANLFDVNTSGFVTTESDPIWQGNSSWIISNASINYSLKTYNLWDERWTSTFNSTYQSYQDTNATTACSSGEVLLGNGSCMDSILYYDDTDTDTWWDIVVGFLYNNSGSLDIDTNVLNATIDDRLIPDTNASTICSSEQVLLGNTSCMSSDLYYDDTTIPDTNVSTFCSTSEVLLGNGTCTDSDLFFDETTITESDPIWQGNSSWIISNASINYSINSYNMWNTIWSEMNHSTFNKTYDDFRNKINETYNSSYQTHINLVNEHIDWTDASDNFLTTGDANFNGNIKIGSNQINDIAGTLYIQYGKAGTIDFQAGLVTITTAGNVDVGGDLTIADGKDIFWSQAGQIGRWDDWHRIVFNPANRMDFYEWGDFNFYNAGSEIETVKINSGGLIVTGNLDVTEDLTIQDDLHVIDKVCIGINCDTSDQTGDVYINSSAAIIYINSPDEYGGSMSGIRLDTGEPGSKIKWIISNENAYSNALLFREVSQNADRLTINTSGDFNFQGGNLYNYERMEYLNTSGDANVEGTTYLGWERVEQTTGTSAVGYANCPSGTKILGGGCDQYDLTQRSLQKSYPYNDTAWHCQYSGSVTTLNAYAICGRVDN